MAVHRSENRASNGSSLSSHLIQSPRANICRSSVSLVDIRNSRRTDRSASVFLPLKPLNPFVPVQAFLENGRKSTPDNPFDCETLLEKSTRPGSISARTLSRRVAHRRRRDSSAVRCCPLTATTRRSRSLTSRVESLRRVDAITSQCVRLSLPLSLSVHPMLPESERTLRRQLHLIIRTRSTVRAYTERERERAAGSYGTRLISRCTYARV